MKRKSHEIEMSEDGFTLVNNQNKKKNYQNKTQTTNSTPGFTYKSTSQPKEKKRKSLTVILESKRYY
jgi:hypothetical protein